MPSAFIERSAVLERHRVSRRAIDERPLPQRLVQADLEIRVEAVVLRVAFDLDADLDHVVALGHARLAPLSVAGVDGQLDRHLVELAGRDDLGEPRSRSREHAVAAAGDRDRDERRAEYAQPHGPSSAAVPQFVERNGRRSASAAARWPAASRPETPEISLSVARKPCHTALLP